MSCWSEKAAKTIYEAMASGAKLGLQGKALEKHVSAAYPFGERAMWPYKQWLKEFNRIVRKKGKNPPSKKPAHNQMTFGDITERDV